MPAGSLPLCEECAPQVRNQAQGEEGPRGRCQQAAPLLHKQGREQSPFPGAPGLKDQGWRLWLEGSRLHSQFSPNHGPWLPCSLCSVRPRHSGGHPWAGAALCASLPHPAEWTQQLGLGCSDSRAWAWALGRYSLALAW